MTDRDDSPLDDPVGESLRGHHTHLARRFGRAATYVPEVATFSTITAASDPRGWADLAQLLGRGQLADLFSCSAQPPAGWRPVFALPARQMVGPTGGTASDAGVVELGDADVPDMLALAEQTRPGPFWARTRELGTYLGVRENGALVAMAGERLRPPGWTEISAVCTAPEAHGRGHATRLITSLIARITARGERPFLHVTETNTGALALYEHLGFTTRKHITIRGYRTP